MQSVESAREHYKVRCYTCFKAKSMCLCADITRYNSSIKFIFLVHPREYRKPIASARIAHLSLPGSEYLVGINFTEHKKILNLLADKHNFCSVLYPGDDAIDIDTEDVSTFAAKISPQQQKIIFIIDGTWAHAKKILDLNPWLHNLTKISFAQKRASGFIIRKQPAFGCLSSIEATCYTLEQLDKEMTPAIKADILRPFHKMVQTQITIAENIRNVRC